MNLYPAQYYLKHVPLGLLLSVLTISPLAGAQGEIVLANFDDKDSIATNSMSHKGQTTIVKDAPADGNMSAAKTIVDVSASASEFFGTGYNIDRSDLSGTMEIRFWIKTDAESDFNFQLHSEDNHVSAFRFSTLGAAGQWQQITAAVESFDVPQWSSGEVDWSAIDRWQLTAFGNGPYDGKYIIVDRVVSVGSKSPRPDKDTGVIERGGAIHVRQRLKSSKTKTPPEGFRSLFDGKTLTGWDPQPRIPVAQYPGAEFKWRLEGEALEAALKNTGRWTVKDGAIVGGQEPPDSGKGAYLVSRETFGDFELMMDMKPDWKTDSGFLIRTLPGGSPGMQILVDHRPQGGIGGFYGNGLAGVHGMPFAIDAEYEKKGNPVRMIAASADEDRVELNEKTRSILTYGADVDAFLKVWKFGQWNTVKVRCEGRIPVITTWVNGMKIAVLDMKQVEWENYDAEACARLQGRKGHISLEVHDTPSNHWLGKDRWWPGAVVRWKNIYIRELN